MTGIGTQIKNALGWFKTNLVNNWLIKSCVADVSDQSTVENKALSAWQGKLLQDQINSLNTNSTGYNQLAYVTFSKYGDYWWISSPIPCLRADKLQISLSDNVKNSTSNGVYISQTLFEVRKYKNYFYLLTNDTSVAGYIFETANPGIVWEVYFSVTKS